MQEVTGKSGYCGTLLVALNKIPDVAGITTTHMTLTL